MMARVKWIVILLLTIAASMPSWSAGVTISGPEAGESFTVPFGGLYGANEAWTEDSGTWAWGADRNFFCGGQFTNNDGSPSVGDAISINLRVPTTGSWTAYILGSVSSDYGRFDVKINGSKVGDTQDLYAASGAYNGWSGGVPLGALAAGTSYTLKLEVAGKNASSSNYNMSFQMIMFVKN